MAGCALAAHGLASKWLDEAKSAPQAKKKMAVLVGVDELLLATPHSNLASAPLYMYMFSWLVPPI